jgi:NTE family protein
MKTALILTHGGLKGAFQVGVLKELVKRGIVPDVVIGGSIGSLNGAVFLSSKDFKKNVELLENLWSNIKRKQVFPLNKEIFYKFFSAKSFYSQEGLKNLLKKIFKKDDFKFLSRPFYVIATREKDIEPVFFFQKGN